MFQGDRYAPRSRPGVKRVRHGYLDGRKAMNSGAGAIAAAHHFGARRVILLGYDCQHTGGRKHWHGDHPEGGGSGNAGSVGKWPAQFLELVRHLAGVEVINCSRETALTVFPRAQLEDVLT